MIMLLVVSLPWKVPVWAKVVFASKQACPLVLLIPGVSPLPHATAVMVTDPGPLVWVMVTVFPRTATLPALMRVAVILLVVVPLAVIVFGFIARVESAASVP